MVTSYRPATSIKFHIPIIMETQKQNTDHITHIRDIDYNQFYFITISDMLFLFPCYLCPK